MSELTAKVGQSIFDICLITYQDASRAYDLLTENPTLTGGINEVMTGAVLQYTKSIVTDKEAVKVATTSKKLVTVPSTQTLFDIALQYYGSAEKVYNLVVQNGLGSILSDPTGITLIYSMSNTFAPIYYRKNNITVSTKPIPVTPSAVNGNYRVTTGFDYRITDTGDFRTYG